MDSAQSEQVRIGRLARRVARSISSVVGCPRRMAAIRMPKGPKKNPYRKPATPRPDGSSRVPPTTPQMRHDRAMRPYTMSGKAVAKSIVLLACALDESRIADDGELIPRRLPCLA